MNKILINKTTGQVINVVKIMRTEDSILYHLYDNGIDFMNNKPLKSETVKFDTTAVPETPMNFSELTDFLGVKTVQAMYSGFEISDEGLNWVHEVGSTGEKTTIRVFLPHELLGKIFGDGSPLDQLVQAMKVFKPWVVSGDRGNVQYLIELLPEHRVLLEMYSSQGVIIQDKPVIKYSVSFHVAETDQSPIEGVMIEMSGLNEVTDINGNASFAFPEGVYPYTVTFPDATTQEGSVTVTSSDVTVEITK